MHGNLGNYFFLCFITLRCIQTKTNQKFPFIAIVNYLTVSKGMISASEATLYHNQVIATLMRIMATAKIVVRVMNDPKNKRTFKKFRIDQFPVMGIVEAYAEHLGFSEAAKAEIGYVGYSNKKFKVVPDNDLEIALGSGGFHKDNIPVLYML